VRCTKKKFDFPLGLGRAGIRLTNFHFKMKVN
jgi:hypothetical protein